MVITRPRSKYKGRGCESQCDNSGQQQGFGQTDQSGYGLSGQKVPYGVCEFDPGDEDHHISYADQRSMSILDSERHHVGEEAKRYIYFFIE